MWYPFHDMETDADFPSDDQAKSSAGRPSALTKPGLLCCDIQGTCVSHMSQLEGPHLPVGKDILGKRVDTGACLCKTNVLILAWSAQSACLDQI